MTVKAIDKNHDGHKEQEHNNSNETAVEQIRAGLNKHKWIEKDKGK